MENQKNPENGATSGFEPSSRPLAVTPLAVTPATSVGSRVGKIRSSLGSIRVVVFVVLGLLVIAGGAYAFKVGSTQQANRGAAQPSDNFGVQDIELTGLTDPNSLGLSTLQSLSINGQLRVNNSLIITPGSQPKQGTAGQIYYDKDGNFLSYYDGEQFLNLANSEDVASLQDQLDELFSSLSVSEESILPDDVATLSDDNVFSGFNVFEGGLESSELAVTGASILQGDLGVDGTTDLTDLNVSGTTALGPTTASSLVLSSPLDVASGGTGASSFASNGILIGQGNNPFTTVSAAGAGLCLISTAGAPTFQACPGGGGATVDSLNGLTGALSIANASGAGTTITIDNATTAARGIASFNATNFSVSAGAVNTIQNIAVTSTPTFAGLTLNGNLSVGSNSIVTSGSTISSVELDVLDGGITEGEVTGVITDVTAGNGLTGGAASGNASLNIASANGAIAINADNIALTLQPTGDSLSATTSSGSGLEILTGGLSLLQGCSDGQILKWNEVSDTWGCAADAGGSGVGDDVSVNGLNADGANFINTVASGSSAGLTWNLNTTPSPDEISISISNASATEAGVVTTGVQSFAGDKTYNNAVTVTGLFTANGNVTIETGDTFTFNGDAFTDLSGTGLVVAGGVLQAALGTSIDSSEITDLTITGADIANDTITDTQLAFDTGQHLTVTSTPTFAGVTLNGNLSLGTNSIVTSGATISSTELDVLDGGIAEGEVTGVITDVTAGNGLTGGAASGNATVNIASANGGIVVGADDIALMLQPTGDALSSTTSSGSGLEILSTGLSLLQGCSDAQILKWSEASDTWGCAADAGGSGVGDDISVNGLAATNANFIDTVASGSSAGVAWVLNTTPSPDDISITISNASLTEAGVVTTGVQSFAGDKTFSSALTVEGVFTVNDDVTIVGANLTFNGDTFTDLTGTGLIVAGGVLQAALGTSIDSSEIDDLTITGADIANDTIALGTKTTGNYVASNTAGTGIAVTGSAGEGWSPTISLDYSADLTTNSLGVNQSSFAATGILFEGTTADAFETLFTVTDPTADNTITLPNASGTVCLVELGNCAGSGTGVTSSGGTTNRLAKFSGSQAINDSTITDDGTNVTTSANMIIQGGNITAGTNAQLGSFILNDGNGQTTTLRAGDSVGDLTFILPTSTGSQFQCLKYDTAGQLIWDDCDGGSGGGSGVTALNGLTGGVTIQGNAQIGVSAASPNINLSVNADSIGDAQLAFNTGQHLTVTSTPTFASLIVTGDSTANRPGLPTEGQVYYDTTTKKLLVYANGKWQADRADAILVAASNSSQIDKDAADYVADGNGGGALDGDQVQINAALTAASGKKVVLLAGTYVADGTILVPNSTTLAGVGMGTLIELDLDASDNLIENIDSANGTGITIRDMKIDGRKDQNSAGTQRGIHLTGMGGGTGATARQGALIENVFVTNFRSENTLLTSSSHNIISDSTFQASTLEGLQFTTSSNNVVTGSKFQGNGASGFNANSSSSTNTLTGNHAQGNSSGGFSLASGSYNTLSGNTSQGNGYGFFITSSWHTITGNTAQGNTSSGIYVSGTNNTVTGNTANGGQYGINIGGDSNDVTGNTMQGTIYGIFVNGNNTTVSGNNVSTAGTVGINLNAANTSTISGNRIHDSGGASANNGISLTNSDSNTIADNIISDTSATTTNYAIAINNTSTTNYLSGNTLGTGSINDLEVGNTNVYGGQVDVSGNFDIQPAGVISLLKNTEVTGTLNVSSDVDTNGSLTVGNANQFVISNLGVVTAGTWQGTAINDTYVADTLTVNGSSTVDWQALNNYPAACSAGQAITQLGDSITCSSFATGTGNDIQNQFASAQTAADFWISGTGRADTALQAPTFDTSGATALTLGGNATSISVVDDITLAAGKSLTITGGVTGGRPASPVEGMIYFDTTTKQLLTYANGKWQADRSMSTKIVAASNASQAVKDAADYVAGGTADQTTINTALTAAAGGKVYLTEGTFTATGTILIPNNTSLVGAGANSTTIRLNVGSGTDNLIENSDTTTGKGITIRDMTLDGSLATGGVQQAIYLSGVSDNYSQLRDLFVSSWPFGNNSIALNDAFIGSFNDVTAGDISFTGSSVDVYTNNNTGGVSLTDTLIISFIGNTLYSSLSLATGSVIDTMTGNNAGSISVASSSVIRTLTGNFTGEISLDTTQSSMVVSANRIHPTGSAPGVALTNADNVQIVGNTFFDGTTSAYAIDIAATTDGTYIADNALAGLTVNDLGTNTVYGGQLNGSGNFMIQPTGTIELMKNTSVTGALTVTGNIDTNGSLTVGNADQFAINNLGVVTGGIWQGSTIGVAYGGTGLTSYTVGDLLYASAATTLSKLGAVASGSCLTSQGVGVAPAWGSCGLAAEADTLSTVTARGASTSTNVVFNGTLTGTSDATFSLSGTENVVINNDLTAGVNMLQITGTPSATSGTTRGILVQQADSANTNGLDVGLYINNGDTDLPITTAIQINNTGGGGYTNLIDTATFDVSGSGVITGATWQGNLVGLAYGGTNNNSYTTNGIVYSNGSALVSTAAGSTGQCLLATTGSAPTWGTCTATNLQGTYDASSPATINLANSKDFTINAADTATDSSIVFNLQCTTCSAEGGRFAIQDAGVDIFRINPNGDIIIGTAANNMTLTASNGYKPVLNGNARNSKKIRLHAEYPSVVLTPDGSNNLGTLTSGYDNTASARMNYYNWTTTQGTNQDYDIVVQIPLPADFSAWDGANPLSITTHTSNTTNGTITLEARDSADAQICNFVSVTPGSTNTWTANNTACTLSTGTYTAGDYITLRIRLQAPTSGNTRVGNITLNYLSKF